MKYLFSVLLVAGVMSVDLHARTEDDTAKIAAAFKVKTKGSSTNDTDYHKLSSRIVTQSPSGFLYKEMREWENGVSVDVQTMADAKAKSKDDTAKIGKAFASKTSDLQVRAKGKVIKILADGNEGSRHQRFIVRLRNKQTLLIAHNIDLAPRVAGLKVGDIIEFYGEYEWNDKGGVIHWTHKDPAGKHVDGWIKLNGKKFE